MFALEAAPASLKALTAYTESHGDEKVSACALKLEVVRPNTALDAFDRGLREALYRKADVISAQQQPCHHLRAP